MKKLLIWMMLAAAPLMSLSLSEATRFRKECCLYFYPYYDLPKNLADRGVEAIPVFCYGSLLDPESAARTFSQRTLATARPTVAFGVKRVFNRDIPISPSQMWGDPVDPNARGMLNLVLTDNPCDQVNGILLRVPVAEIEKMRKRELGYELQPVVITNWKEYRQNRAADFFIAYSFHAREETDYTNGAILPRPGYYELTRNAAKRMGGEFYRMWMETTFMPDGITSIEKWEEEVNRGTERTRQTKRPATS